MTQLNIYPLPMIKAYEHVLSSQNPDDEGLRPYFGWVNADIVQKTIEQSTQWGFYPELPHEETPRLEPST